MSLLKKIILGLFLSSFIGYLEWGKMSSYIGEIEYGLLLQINDSLEAFLHPFILMPLLGQLCLLILLLIRKPKFSWVVIVSIGIVLLFLLILLAGLLSRNLKMIFSTLPYLGLYGFLLLKRKKLYL